MGRRIALCFVDVPHHTTKVHRGDPFLMTYGVEAVIPLETNFPTLKTSTFYPNANNWLLEKSLDLNEERRERAMV